VDAVAVEALAGGGEMGGLVRAFDWSATALGPIAAWPRSLRTIVGILLTTRHPMFLWWGPGLIQFYNDGYRASLGPERHPSALGQPGPACWAEVWDTVGPQIRFVLETGDSTWHEDHLVPITRGGRLQDVFWSYSYSPVRDDEGEIRGVLATVQETTRRVLAERRLRLLAELAEAEAAARSQEEACALAAAVLGRHTPDVPFARLHLREAPARGFRLVAQTGAMPESLARAHIIHPGKRSGPRRLEALLRDLGPLLVTAFEDPAERAMVLPVPADLVDGTVDGLLVVGVSPAIALDQAHRDFLSTLATQVAQSIGTARAHDRARRRAEALSQELSRLDTLFKKSPAFLAVLRGPELRFELVNPAYSRLIGQRDVLGKPAREAMPEVEGQGFFELLEVVYRTGEPFVGNELRMHLQSASGAPLEAHYFSFAYQAMRDAQGVIWGVLATGYDVTEQVRSRQAAERLAAEREIERRQLHTLLEQAPVGIVVREAPSGRLLYANRRAEIVLGASPVPDQLPSGDEQFRCFDADGRLLAPEEWPMNRAMLRGEVVELQIMRVEHVDGRRIEISANAAPVRDASGRIVAGVAFFQDVAAERRREQQLQDAQRLQSVGTLAGGVAHEINNQMTVVLNFGEFILEALGSHHPQAADLRVVLQAGMRAVRVSQQLLAFTRRQVTQPRDVVLPELAAGLLPVLGRLLGPDKTLELAALRSTWHVHADPGQLEQVLINLVANARDATPTGGRVSIGVADVVHVGPSTADRGYAIQPGRYVVLTVADTGRGMDAATLARVFEPFYTTKPVGEGTGLGLSMVYGIVKQHRGYIEADSAPGEGTTFRVCLPAVSEPETVAGGPDAAASSRETGDVARRPAVVVVVEDEREVRVLTVRALEKAGYVTLAAADGAAGLELVREHPEVEVVVTDMIMPYLNGRQLADQVAELRPGVPVLFTSGHTADAAVLRELLPPRAPYLQKPFTGAELTDAVDGLIQQRH
jgi:signal transduction histidine kinase/CheY-like chemotaxis protein